MLAQSDATTVPPSNAARCRSAVPQNLRPFPLCHKHHLEMKPSIQMVLLRPVELARLFAKWLAFHCR